MLCNIMYNQVMSKGLHLDHYYVQKYPLGKKLLEQVCIYHSISYKMKKCIL